MINGKGLGKSSSSGGVKMVVLKVLKVMGIIVGSILGLVLLLALLKALFSKMRVINLPGMGSWYVDMVNKGSKGYLSNGLLVTASERMMNNGSSVRPSIDIEGTDTSLSMTFQYIERGTLFFKPSMTSKAFGRLRADGSSYISENTRDGGKTWSTGFAWW